MTKGVSVSPGTSFWLAPWCLVLFLFPFKQLIPGPPFMVLEVGAALLLMLAPRPRAVLANGRFVAISFLMLAICASYFSSLNPAESREPTLRLGVAYLTYILATSVVLERHELVQTLKAWLWGGAAASLALQSAFMQGVTTFGGRATMTLGAYRVEPNFFAVELILPFAIGLYFLRQRATRWGAIVPLLLIVGGTLTTQSRGGLVSLLVVVFALLAFERRWLTLAGLFAAIVTLYVTFAPLLGRYNLADDPTGSSRTLIWHVLIPVALDHWPTGIGLNATWKVTSFIGGFYKGIGPHNTYIQAFLEVGLVGLVGLLAAIATHLAIPGDKPLTNPIRAGLCGMAITGIFLHLLAVQSFWVPWIIAAQAALIRSPEPAQPGREATPARLRYGGSRTRPKIRSGLRPTPLLPESDCDTPV